MTAAVCCLNTEHPPSGYIRLLVSGQHRRMPCIFSLYCSPPREEQQAHQTVAAEVRELQGTAPAPVPQSAAWLQHTQPQAVSDLRTQQEHEVLAQLRAQQVQLLQLTAAVSQATASASFSISSSPSRKLLSLPNESQQLGIGSIDASRLFASRPGEVRAAGVE